MASGFLFSPTGSSSPGAGGPADLGRTSLFIFALEKLVPPDKLRISAVPYFHPRRIMGISGVAALPVLGDNAFQVLLAGKLKETFAVALNVINVEQER